MDRIQREVVQTLFTFLVDNVDPRYVMAELYRRRGMSRQLIRRINDDECSRHRSENFFLEIVDTCPFHILINCLRHTRHTFVAKRLLNTYCRMKRDGNTVQMAVNQQLESLSITDEKYVYEELRLYRDNGAIETLERRVSGLVWRWDTEYRDSKSTTKKACMARIVMDAKLAWIRFLLEADKPCDVLSQIHDVGSLIIHTEHPLISTVMVLAVQVQMLLFPRKSNLEDAVQKYNSIKLMAASLPLDAIHFVNFYVAEFCIDCISYERTGEQGIRQKMRNSLDKMMASVNDMTSGNEVEKQYRSSFIRRSLLVKVLLCLGMTHRGKCITESVSENDIVSAKHDLQQVFSEWEKLEMKWKMLFHVAQARLQMFEGNHEEALAQAEHAQSLSHQLHHSEERRNIFHLLQNVRNTLKG
ncbi:uncharacterized protein LOC117336483 [Pecten maximus]|uniref:uncharacterized protein LOC117336483 n=1 Tax=Pecten maximus TaxID=6579 RepID=UPI0014591398|nr:uncharacterized protein LOC117336483 [Pecten maximus]